MATTTKKNMPVMAHLVLGYPTLEESLRTALQYAQAGCAILELQIPFSHPTADGSVITAACREAIENQQVRVEDSLLTIGAIRARCPSQEIIVMSYVNRIFAYGFAAFAKAMNGLGIRHLIVPDLPVDSALAKELQAADVQLVPVLAANVTTPRLEKLLAEPFDFYYLMSDFKITGSTFSLHPRLQHIIQRIQTVRPAARIGIGFGISSPEQAKLAAAEAHYAIIGSALIAAQREERLAVYLNDLQAAFAE